MASNRELAAQAETLAHELGVNVRTFGLNQAALAELVEELQEKLATRAIERASGTGPTDPAPEKPPGGALLRPPPGTESVPLPSLASAPMPGHGAAQAPARESAVLPGQVPGRETEYATAHDNPFAPPRPPLDGATGKLADPPPEPAPRVPRGYSVAPKKSITSKRGMIGPGESVYPKDFADGQATIEDLLSKGILLKGDDGPA